MTHWQNKNCGWITDIGDDIWRERDFVETVPESVQCKRTYMGRGQINVDVNVMNREDSLDGNVLREIEFRGSVTVLER